jgi:hypothetical protein
MVGEPDEEEACEEEYAKKNAMLVSIEGAAVVFDEKTPNSAIMI